MTALVTQTHDWECFRSIERLCQKAGVPPERLPRLVVKELVDNALDAAGSCRFGELGGGGFFVEDDGDGLPGSDEDIAVMFSIGRPLVSSKQLRMPSRGALGNGLRVVTGAVLASGGALTVKTRGRSLTLAPCDDGTTTVKAAGPWEGKGVRVEAVLGDCLASRDPDPLAWARLAMLLAGRGTSYPRRSSPWWYDSDSFWELCRSARNKTIRAVVEELEGCGRNKATRITEGFADRKAGDLKREEAGVLLMRARSEDRTRVQPSRLGAVGKLDDYPGYSGCIRGTFEVQPGRGKIAAEIPFVVEAWAKKAGQPSAVAFVNRTPIADPVEVYRPAKFRTDYVFNGCDLCHRFPVVQGHDFAILVNVQTPHMPITTDGKAPDWKPVADEVLDAIAKAVKIAHRAARSAKFGGAPPVKKEVVIKALPQAIKKASGDGKHRFSLRQLFYAVRPEFLEVFGEEPNYDTFSKIITEHEAETGRDVPGIYRDARGTLYHPHLGEEINLGTLSVEAYRRPRWTFNKILYCEKEGFFSILRPMRWPERNDCALLTSKGFATRAARDVLDLLAETGEELTFFAIHDADGPGTKIYESLQEATLARPGRKVKIINLGLEPSEAVDMALQVEPVNRKKGAVPVGAYIPETWRVWLQKNRVELNAMTTPQFVAWLDRKMAPYLGKVIPPPEVLREQLLADTEAVVMARAVEEAIMLMGVDDQVRATMARLQPLIEEQTPLLPVRVEKELLSRPEHRWTEPVRSAAADLAAKEAEPVNGRKPSKSHRKRAAKTTPEASPGVGSAQPPETL